MFQFPGNTDKPRRGERPFAPTCQTPNVHMRWCDVVYVSGILLERSHLRIKNLGKAIALNPNLALLYNNIGLIQYDTGAIAEVKKQDDKYTEKT